MERYSGSDPILFSKALVGKGKEIWVILFLFCPLYILLWPLDSLSVPRFPQEPLKPLSFTQWSGSFQVQTNGICSTWELAKTQLPLSRSHWQEFYSFLPPHPLLFYESKPQGRRSPSHYPTAWFSTWAPERLQRMSGLASGRESFGL